MRNCLLHCCRQLLNGNEFCVGCSENGCEAVGTGPRLLPAHYHGIDHRQAEDVRGIPLQSVHLR